MNIIERIEKVKSLVSTYDDALSNFIGFLPETEDEILQRYVKHGKWNCVQFSANSKRIGCMGLRVVPWKKSIDWHVCKTLPYHETVNLFPTFCDYIELQPVLNGCASKSYFSKYKENFEVALQARLPLFELFEGKGTLGFLKQFFNEKSNCPSEQIEDMLIASNQMKVSNQYYGSELSNFFTKYVSQMKEDDFLPQLPSLNLDYLEERILSSLAIKASINAFDFSFEKIEPLLLNTVKYAHGFGTERFDITFEAAASDTSSHVFDPIETLLADYMRDDNSKEVKESPEYDIALSMNEMQNSYNGVAHLEVAALMDDQYNDPKKSWKYLEAAGYWIGKNLPEAQVTVVDAAISLCKKHGWLEAVEVLEHNKQYL
jgi:hypothetical protein